MAMSNRRHLKPIESGFQVMNNRDIELITKLVMEAIDKKEKVMIYGDYDVDGITSITVLKNFFIPTGEHPP